MIRLGGVSWLLLLAVGCSGNSLQFRAGKKGYEMKLVKN
jgi:hypothetical protein